MEIAMVAGSIMLTAALNCHPAAALQQQLLAAAPPAAQLLLSALRRAPVPGPVHLHMLPCPIRGLQDHTFTREADTLGLISSSTLFFNDVALISTLLAIATISSFKTPDPAKPPTSPQLLCCSTMILPIGLWHS